MTEGAQEWKDGNGGWRFVARLGGRVDSCLRRNDGGGAGMGSGGWRLVARLGGRMDSCLRRNDGGGAGMTEGAQEWRKDGSGGWNGGRMGMAEGAQEWRKDGGMGMAEVVEMVERADFGIDADCAPPASRAR